MKVFSPQNLLCLLSLPLAGALHGETIDIFSIGGSSLQSTYIREAQTSVPSYSSGDAFILGQTTTSDDYLRALFTFDLSDPLLTGATINSVTLTLTGDRNDSTSSAGAVTLELFELTTAYDYQEATWTAATDSTNWTSPGGDFSGLAIATASADPTVVTTGSEVDFTGSGLNTIVQSSLGGNVYFIAKLGTEDDVLRKIFFFEREGNSGRPTLTIDYTPVPEASTFALMAGVLSLSATALRRRR